MVFHTYFTDQNKYVEMNLNGEIDYQRFQWFDKTQTLTSLLDAIDAAKNDPSVTGTTTGRHYQIYPDVRSIVLT
jgi:hypothetical protein